MSKLTSGDQELSQKDSDAVKKALGLPAEARLSVTGVGGAKKHAQQGQVVPQKQNSPQQQPAHLRGTNEDANPGQPQFEIAATPGIAALFLANNVSLLATAYKSNLVFSFGSTTQGQLSSFYTVFPRPMAIATSPRQDCLEVWIGCRSHLVRCCDAGGAYNDSGSSGQFTSSLVARQLYGIGAQDIHGIYPSDVKEPWFISTSFSALCKLNTANPEVTTQVVWKPPFVSELRGEDRCHFNGLAWVNGLARFATCVCESDAFDGWRDHRQGGGVIVDVMSGNIVVRNLSMPHSPMVYKDELWLLNSGTGYLGVIDFSGAATNNGLGVFVPKIFLPGFLRGLQFVGRYAFVGSSLDRHEKRFQDLALGANLNEKKTTPVCGIYVVDLSTLTIVDKIGIRGNVHELYDLALVPGARARVMGLNDEETFKWSNLVSALVQPETLSGEEEDSYDENEEEDSLTMTTANIVTATS